MAQTGYTPIQIYHSTTATNVPLAADLVQGELALNTADGKLYYKDSSNVVQLLTSAGTGGGTVTSVNGSGGTTGLTLTGGPFTNTGTLTLGGTLAIANGGTGQITANAALNALLPTQATNAGKVLSTDGANTSWITVSGGGGGTVTAVNASYPVTVTGTTTPTIGLACNGGGSPIAVTGSTGIGAMVCNNTPTLVSPILGTPTSGTLTNCTGLPLTTGVTGSLPVANGGTGVTTSTGSGNNVLSTSPTLVSPILGTPTSGTLTNCTGLPLTTGVSGTLSMLNGGTGVSASAYAGGVAYGASTTQIGTTIAGTSGQLLQSNGASAPSWVSASSLTVGTAGTCTGNAATVTSGVYTTGTQTIGGSKTFSSTLNTAAISATGSVLSNNTGFSGSSTTLSFLVNNVGTVAINSSFLFPNTDNNIACGSGVTRWSVVYAATGTINTSDANEKQQIENLTTKEKAVGLALKGMMKSFKFNDSVRDKGSLARVHFGVIAQDVKAAFEAQGLNADNYGVFCSDVLEDGSTRLGVRYEELFALIIGSI